MLDDRPIAVIGRKIPGGKPILRFGTVTKAGGSGLVISLQDIRRPMPTR